LLDRMDVIRLSGYILEEKSKIARQYLWPRQLEKAGFDKKELRITAGAIEKIIDDYAREAGVRQLEKQLAKIVRKAAVKFETEELENFSVGVNEIVPFLGNPYFNREKPVKNVGVVTG